MARHGVGVDLVGRLDNDPAFPGRCEHRRQQLRREIVQQAREGNGSVRLGAHHPVERDPVEAGAIRNVHRGEGLIAAVFAGIECRVQPESMDRRPCDLPLPQIGLERLQQPHRLVRGPARAGIDEHGQRPRSAGRLQEWLESGSQVGLGLRQRGCRIDCRKRYHHRSLVEAQICAAPDVGGHQ